MCVCMRVRTYVCVYVRTKKRKSRYYLCCLETNSYPARNCSYNIFTREKNRLISQVVFALFRVNLGTFGIK